MENNIYLDKVLDHLVRNTKIDYEGKEIYVPFTNHSFHMFFPSLYNLDQGRGLALCRSL